jgi:tartrate-resistant acid phosphatase type 5
VLVLATWIAMVRSAPPPPARDLPQEPMSARLELPQRNAAEIRLAVIGDLHGQSGLIAGALRKEHRRAPLDAVLVLGDNFDDCGVGSAHAPEWKNLEPLLALDLPLYPILGNHDYGNPKRRYGQIAVCGDPFPVTQLERRATNDNWIFPARNYVLHSPLVDIVMTDTTPVALNAERSLLGSATAAEIRRFAGMEVRQSRAPWQVVTGHHNAQHSGVQRWKGGATRRNMAAFARSIADAGADAYLSGHQHHLEILKEPAVPLVVISGAASSPRHPDTLQRIEQHSVYAAAREGYALMLVARDKLTVTLHSLDGSELARSAATRR